jgi:hypothetical protein
MPKPPSRTIGSVIRGFKVGVTKWFRANTDVHEVWLRNYYDIIIRDRRAYHAITRYIRKNPEKWGKGRNKRKTGSPSLRR